MTFRANTVGKKLLWGIALPATLVAIAGVSFYWREADSALREATQREAGALADLVATTFQLVDTRRDEAGQTAHRAVSEAFRSDWSVFGYVEDLRVLDRAGVVRWSRRIEEEGRRLPDSDRILAAATSLTMIDGRRAELVRPLGGVACAGCHAGEATMRAGVVHLTIDEPALRREVADVFQKALESVLWFALAIAVATGLSLHLFLHRPLRQLAAAMKRAEEGDFVARAPAGDGDELGRLGAAFNRMLARITAMKAEEIDTHRDLRAAQDKLTLQEELQASKEKLEHRLNELSLLYDVARSFTATLELPVLFGRITALVAERLSIPQFSIMLRDRDGRLEIKSAYPANVGSEGLTFAPSEGAAGQAARTLRAVYLPSIADDQGIYLRRGARRDQGSLLCVPMVHKEELLGVLNFQRPEVASFSAEEIELLTAVADQAAMAVKNARLHEETVALSLTDPLTGVPNRRSLFTRLETEIARANRFGTQVSVVMIDIDHFKHLNDVAGHRAGDEILRKVADLMKCMVRKVDILARYGGEEFMLVLPQVNKAESVEVAEKLRRAIDEAPLPHRETQPLGRITISVGVSNLPTDATALEDLVDCADSALYASKRGGRNKVTGYQLGMEMHPGRERGPYARKKPDDAGTGGPGPAPASGDRRS